MNGGRGAVRILLNVTDEGMIRVQALTIQFRQVQVLKNDLSLW